MNKMLDYLNGYKRECVLAPLFKMLEASFDLFVPLVMADIVNVGIAAHDFHYILMRVRYFAAAGHHRPRLQPYRPVLLGQGLGGLLPPPCATRCSRISRP